MLGKINILFGEVVDLNDEEKKFRCRVSINGYTDQLETEDLPWYYPFGIRKLPSLGDTVAVTIFDGIITNGFYTDPLNLKINVSEEDYQNYVEVFDKSFEDGNTAKLTFTQSRGIESLYGNSYLSLTKEKINISSGSNEINIDDDKITLGGNPTEPILLGNKTIDFLQDLLNAMIEITKEFSSVSSDMLNWQTACATPFTAAMAPAVAGIMASMTALSQKIGTLGVKLDSLKSQKIITE